MDTLMVTGDEGIRLHVMDAGKRAGKPIVFIHGLSQCSLVWSRQLSSELAQSFRLVAMDIRGHGLSDKPRDAYGNSRFWADDVHAVIRQLELVKPLLVGWSYGGAIMSDYVACYGEDEIAGTNWIGAVCRLGEPLVAGGFLGERFLAAVPGLFSESVDESVNALDGLIDLCIPSGISAEERYLMLGFNVVVPPHVRQGLLSRNVDNDAVVGRMSKPMLLSWGEEDAVVLPAMRDHIGDLVQHARVSTYPEVGHAPFWEASERFNRELRDFREAI